MIVLITDNPNLDSLAQDISTATGIEDKDQALMLAFLIAGLLLLAILLTIIIIVRNRRRRRRKAAPEESIPYTDEELRIVDSEDEGMILHPVQIPEDADEKYRPKEEGRLTEIVSPEPPVEKTILPPPASEVILTQEPEIPVQEPEIAAEKFPGPKPLPETSADDKKKEVLKAIGETSSREDNLRLIQERLKEIMGDSYTPPVKTPVYEEKQEPEISADAIREEMPEPLKSFLPVAEETEPDNPETETIPEAPAPEAEILLPHAEKTADVVEELPEIQTETPEDQPDPEQPLSEKEAGENASSIEALSREKSPKTFTEWLSEFGSMKRK